MSPGGGPGPVGVPAQARPSGGAVLHCEVEASLGADGQIVLGEPVCVRAGQGRVDGQSSSPGGGLSAYPVDANIRINLDRWIREQGGDPLTAEPEAVAPNVVVWDLPGGARGFVANTADGGRVIGERQANGRTAMRDGGFPTGVGPTWSYSGPLEELGSFSRQGTPTAQEAQRRQNSNAARFTATPELIQFAGNDPDVRRIGNNVVETADGMIYAQLRDGSLVMGKRTAPGEPMRLSGPGGFPQFQYRGDVSALGSVASENDLPRASGFERRDPNLRPEAGPNGVRYVDPNTGNTYATDNMQADNYGQVTGNVYEERRQNTQRFEDQARRETQAIHDDMDRRHTEEMNQLNRQFAQFQRDSAAWRASEALRDAELRAEDERVLAGSSGTGTYRYRADENGNPVPVNGGPDFSATTGQVLGDLVNIDPRTGERRPPASSVLTQGRNPNQPTITAADPNRPAYTPPSDRFGWVPGEVAGFVYEAASGLPGLTTLAGQGLNAVTGGRAPGLENLGRAWQQKVDDFYTGPQGIFRPQSGSVEFEDGRMLQRVVDLATGPLDSAAGAANSARRALDAAEDATSAARPLADGASTPPRVLDGPGGDRYTITRPGQSDAAPGGVPTGSPAPVTRLPDAQAFPNGAAGDNGSVLLRPTPQPQPPTPESVLDEVMRRPLTAADRIAAENADLPPEVRQAIGESSPTTGGLPTQARADLDRAVQEMGQRPDPDLSFLDRNPFYDADTNRTFYQDPQTGRLRAYDPGDYATVYDPKKNETSILQYNYEADTVEAVPFGRGDNRTAADRASGETSTVNTLLDSQRIGPLPSPANVDAIQATVSRLNTTARDRVGLGAPRQSYPLADPNNPPPASTRDINTVGKPVRFDKLANDNPVTGLVGDQLAGAGGEARYIEGGPRLQGTGPFAQTRFFMTFEDVKNFLRQPSREDIVRFNPEADLMLPQNYRPLKPAEAADFAYRPGQGGLMENFDVNVSTQAANEGLSTLINRLSGGAIPAPAVNKVNFFEISSNRNGPDGSGAVVPVDPSVSPSGWALNVAYDPAKNVYVLQRDLEVKATKQVQLDVGPIKTRIIDYPGTNGGYGLIRAGTELSPSEMAYLEDGIRHPVQYASEGQPKDPASRYDLFRVRITAGPVPGLPTPTFLDKIEFPNNPGGAPTRRVDLGLKVPLGPGHGLEVGVVGKFAVRDGQSVPADTAQVAVLDQNLAVVDRRVVDEAQNRRPDGLTVINILPTEGTRAPDGSQTVTSITLENAMSQPFTGASNSWSPQSQDAIMRFLGGLDEATNPAVGRAYAVFGRSPATGGITREQREILQEVLRNEARNAQNAPSP